ncbi:MAG: hypothetical protein GMKNLPBB_00772 [Myxococcota bacterium]|nr:hypothetical protein [Myxococcota bacterium]
MNAPRQRDKARLKSAACFTCQSRNRSEWCAIRDDDIATLNEGKVCHTYRPGQIIFHQGHPCDGVYCVESGTVLLRKSDPEGNGVSPRLIQEGQTLGYRAFFSGGPYSATAEALAESRICFVPRDVVNRLLDHNPALGLQFLKRMAEDLRQSEESFLQSVVMPVKSRLAHLLLTLKDRFGDTDAEGNLTIDLPLSRQDIASMLGSRPETVTRAMRMLEEEGVARFNGRTVLVSDLDLLMDCVEFCD